MWLKEWLRKRREQKELEERQRIEAARRARLNVLRIGTNTPRVTGAVPRPVNRRGEETNAEVEAAPFTPIYIHAVDADPGPFELNPLARYDLNPFNDWQAPPSLEPCAAPSPEPTAPTYDSPCSSSYDSSPSSSYDGGSGSSVDSSSSGCGGGGDF